MTILFTPSLHESQNGFNGVTIDRLGDVLSLRRQVTTTVCGTFIGETVVHL